MSRRIEGTAVVLGGSEWCAAIGAAWAGAGATLADAAAIADAELLLCSGDPVPADADFATGIAHGLAPMFRQARAALGPMRSRGRGTLIFLAPRQPDDDGDVLAATIAGGLATFVRSIAYQYGADGIRTAMILPGGGATDAAIAAAAVLLASPDARFMTGLCLPVARPEPSRWPG